MALAVSPCKSRLPKKSHNKNIQSRQRRAPGSNPGISTDHTDMLPLFLCEDVKNKNTSQGKRLFCLCIKDSVLFKEKKIDVRSLKISDIFLNHNQSEKKHN